MAVIQNDRDVLLRAAAVRVVPVPIPISQVEGLEDELDNLGNSVTSALNQVEGLENELDNLGNSITSVLNNTKNLAIYANATSFIGTTTTSPTSITLTAEKRNGLTGTVSWGVIYGSATITPSGDTCSVAGASVTGSSVTIRARVTVGATNHDAYVTLTKLGTLAGQATVNLATQVAGQLASGNITGLGALATLNTVNLNTQTTGALNGQTQVTNLGALAYANAIAADQIGAGQLAAGVIYAGQIVATQIKSGSFAGKTFTGGTFSGTDIQTNTGTIGGVRINANGLNTGGYGGYVWPASGQNGFHLGPSGLLIGNANDGKYFQVTSDGNIYTPGFNVVGGNATFSGSLSGATGSFSGSLSGATGSFSGSLTANAINAVNTINIAGNAVTLAVASIGGTVSFNGLVAYTPADLCTLGFSSTGAPTLLFAGVHSLRGSASIGEMSVIVRTVVDGWDVRSNTQVPVNQVFGSSSVLSAFDGSLTIPPILITGLSAGWHTVALQIYATATLESFNNTASGATLAILETKR